ncbi:MAG: hypothetical protein RSE61_05780 [Anaerovoracaceae bacterium]
MLPDFFNLNDFADGTIEENIGPSKTYVIEDNKIIGIIDGLDALKKSVFFMLSTERDEGKGNLITRNACVNYLKGYPIDVFCDPASAALKEEIKWVNSRGIKTKRQRDGQDYHGFIRQTNCPAGIIETAFVDNKNDAKFIDTATDLKLISFAVARAVLKTYGIKNNGYKNDKDNVYYIALKDIKIYEKPDTNSKNVATFKKGVIVKVDPEDSKTVDKGEWKQYWRKIGEGRWICVKGKARYAGHLG